MMRAIASAMEADPGALFRSDASSLEEALRRFREREEGGAADVTGGDWIDDVERIVRTFTSVVKEEKDFFLTIIKLIFCGCDKI
jgi:phosphoribosylaminoimidazole (AIR) synthetase